MNINGVLPGLQKKIIELTEDDQFQKIYAEDYFLNEFIENQQRQKIDRRTCQLVIDYLISKGKVNKSFRQFWITLLHSSY